MAGSTVRKGESRRDRHHAAHKDLEDQVRHLLKEQLNIIWKAQSDATQVAAVRKIIGGIKMMSERYTTDATLATQLSRQMFSSMAAFVLVDAAHKIPPNKDNDKSQYLNTLKMMALLMYEMYLSDKQWEQDTVKGIMRNFAKALDAGRWEVRYRIMQFINFFLDHCDDVMFECVEENTAENKDFVKHQILLRAYDINSRVAALAMEAIGHYQNQVERSPEISKAFSVLFFRMQEHDSALVRCAATKSIVVCITSAPAILRRVVDKSPEVRAAAYGILAESIAPKVISGQLRSYLLLVGLNDENVAVKSAALSCLAKWMKDTGANFDAMVSDRDVDEEHPTLFARKTFKFEAVFDSESAYPLKENVGAGTRAKRARNSTLDTAQNASSSSVSFEVSSVAGITITRALSDNTLDS